MVGPFRVSGVRSGGNESHCFGTSELLEAVAGAVIEVTKWPVDLDHPAVEVMVMLSGNNLLVGLPWGITRPEACMARRKAVVSLPQEKRSYFLPIESTAHRGLRASVCNGLLRLAGNILPGHVVVDAFAGTGNIAIECGVRFKAVQVFSCDADEDAVSLSVPRIRHAGASLAAGSTVSCMVADARHLPFSASSVDHFVCDLPFGNHTVGSAGGDRSNTAGLLPEVLREVARCLKPGGRCVWLLLRNHARQVAVILQQPPLQVLAVEQVREVVVAGWPCSAIVIQRQPGKLIAWEGGAALPHDLDSSALHTTATVGAPLTDGLQMMFPFHLTSQAAARKAVTRRRVFVDGTHCTWHHHVEAGSKVSFFPEYGPLAAYQEKPPLSVLYEDEHYAVLVKPNGLPIHRGKRSLQNILRGDVITKSTADDALDPPVILSPLSKEVGGAVLVAKTATATKSAQKTTLFQALVVLPDELPERDEDVTETVVVEVMERVPSVRFGSVARATLTSPGGDDEVAAREYLKRTGTPVVGEPEVTDIGRGLCLWAYSISFTSDGCRKEVRSDPPAKFDTVLQRFAKEKPKPPVHTVLGEGAA